jgi:hypothetical protein
MMNDEPSNAKHYAIVQRGLVTNVVVWDGETSYNPDGDLVLIDGLTTEPGIGWDYDGEQFADNRPQPEPFEV